MDLCAGNGNISSLRHTVDVYTCRWIPTSMAESPLRILDLLFKDHITVYTFSHCAPTLKNLESLSLGYTGPRGIIPNGVYSCYTGPRGSRDTL